MNQQMEALSDRLGLKGDERLNEEEFIYLLMMLQAHRTHQLLMAGGLFK